MSEDQFHFRQVDRDLLVRMDTKLERIGTDMRELAASQAQISARVERLEDSKLNKNDFSVMHEKYGERITALESDATRLKAYLTVIVFLVGILQFIISKYF